MQCTGYYRILDNSQNDIEDLTNTLIVNCTGRMHTEDKFSTNLIHGRSDYYLLYITEGQMTVYIHGTPMVLSSGMGITYYARTHYQYQFDGLSPISYYWVHFTGNAAKDILENLGLKNECIFDIGVHSHVISLFEKMATEIICREPYFAFSAATYLLQMLVRIQRYLAPDMNVAPKKLKKSLELMHNNYDSVITIENLARMENLSPGRYRVLFHNLTGTSPKQYLTDIRMRHACELLCQTELPIFQIANQVGYDDLLYFDRVFKKYYHMTPSYYRKKYSTK